jgi:hypothetical protein
MRRLILRNESIAPRLAVPCGVAPNTYGVGAKIRVFGGAVAMQSQETICGGRYLSGDAPMLVFAAGTVTNNLSIEVTWRNGKRTRVEHAVPNCIYEVNEARAVVPEVANRTALPSMFSDVSTLLNHRHHDEPFDDFNRQPLLPRKFSQSGPGVAWFDLDEDGHDELIIGNGRRGPIEAFHFTGGKFALFARSMPLPEDCLGLAGTSDERGRPALLAALSSYETGQTNAIALQLEVTGKSFHLAGALAPAPGTNPGPIAVGDVNGDNRLDLFLGGQSLGISRTRLARPSLSGATVAGNRFGTKRDFRWSRNRQFRGLHGYEWGRLAGPAPGHKSRSNLALP